MNAGNMESFLLLRFFPKDSKDHLALLKSYNRSVHGNHRESKEERSMSNSVHPTSAFYQTLGIHGTIWGSYESRGVLDLAQQMEQNLC